MRIAIMAILALPPFLLPSLAAADDVAKALDGDFCFARPAVAARHGETPFLGLKPAPADVPRDAGSLAVEVSMGSAGQALTGLATCSPGDGRLDCSMEGDAGTFAVTLDGPAVVIWSGPDGIGFEGADAFVTWGEGGDRAAALPACAGALGAAATLVTWGPRGGR